MHEPDRKHAADPPADRPADEPAGGSGVVDTIGAAAQLRRLDNAVGRGEQAILAILLVVLIAVGAGQAVVTKLGITWGWSFELIRYSVFFIAMAGAALSAHTEQLLAMDLFTHLLGPRGLSRLRVVLRLFTLAMCVLLVLGGKALSDSAANESLYHIISPQLGLLALPIGAGLMAFHVLVHFVIDAMYLLRGVDPPGRGQTRALH